MKLGIRSSGVLLHATSLPGPFGIGDLGGADEFAAQLAGCGQSWWQMLPVGPPGIGDSPYSALSAFAGSPMLLSLDRLAEQGLLRPRDRRPPKLAAAKADYRAVERFKWPRLRRAFAAFEAQAGAAERTGYEAFCAENARWLDDYALFAAIRDARRGAPWIGWEPGLRLREPSSLDAARRELARELGLQRFVQYQFSLQWSSLRKRCARLGLGLIGDIPIFAAHDSADVWAHRELFWLEPSGEPAKAAGVPPDAFSATGQLWGNPVYRWDALRERGFDWWLARFRGAFERFDTVRLDHFIGFCNYWAIPAGNKTAESGEWLPGPGAELFEKVRAELGPRPLIAEDLGIVTQPVRDLRDRFGFPGLLVLQFMLGADPRSEGYRPAEFPRSRVVYTGTHDNDATAGWFRGKDLGEEGRAVLLRYLGTDGSEIHWDLIRLALSSSADTAVIPMQDLLGLGSEARMNRPGTERGNWIWRMKDGAFTPEIQSRLARLTEEFARRPR